MDRICLTSMFLLLAALSSAPARAEQAGGPHSFHDKLNPALPGGITGVVSPVNDLEEVLIVEPNEFKVYPASIDRKAGRFTVRGLGPGKYDVMLKFRTIVIEGLRFDVPGGFQKLSKEDIAAIEQVTWVSDDYFNNKTIARMGGNGQRVKLLNDQVRDKLTVDPGGNELKGLLVRRLELTDMRKTGQIWTIKDTRHLFREERDKTRPGAELKFAYVQELGGIRVGDTVDEIPPFDLSKLKEKRPDYFHTAHHREP